MRRFIITLAAALVLAATGLTAAANARVTEGTGTTVTKFCVFIENVPGHYYTNGDLNVKHGSRRVCIAGKPGEDGAVGPQGAAGADGRDGVDGSPGSDGRDGTDGLDGLQGIPGPEGPAGPAGPAGADGRDGVDGTITGTVPVCASPGGNLKVCDGDNGHDAIIGYLSLISG